MLTQTAPTSQKDKPIGFVLDAPNSTVSHTLAIRPEDLVRSTPSRLTVQQTLDGDGWADNFGPGLGQITISGHTGWRPNQLDGLDWKASFDKLNDIVFNSWHSYRAAQAKIGKDPNAVKLIFVDTLNGMTSVVAPVSFQLKRSKSRPLLMQYSIILSVLKQNAGDYSGNLKTKTNLSDKKLGLDSMTNSINSMTAKINSLSSWLDAVLLSPLRSFLTMTTSVMSAVNSAITAVGKVAGVLAAGAMMIIAAGSNIFHTLGMLAGLPATVRAQYMALGGIFTNFKCLMRNAFNTGKAIPDYSAFFGASVCSSTSGGSPLMPYSSTSSLVALSGSSLGGSSLAISGSAVASLSALGNNDPVNSQMSVTTIATHATTVAGGVKVP
jgi:hypothetical protein